MTFGKNLRKFRIGRQLKRRELAKALGISETAVDKWEDTENVPHHKNLMLLCLVLRVTPNDLLGYHEVKPYVDSVDLRWRTAENYGNWGERHYFGREFRIVLGEKIFAAMELRNCRAVDLAKVIGVTPATVSTWVHGIHYPSGDRVNKIAEYLQLPVSHFTSID